MVNSYSTSSSTKEVCMKVESSFETPPSTLPPRINDLAGIRPVFLEICAGSAVLSFYIDSLSSQSVQVLPVDYHGNKHNPKVPVTTIDLTEPLQLSILRSLIASGSVVASHIAPPCGTCSRAREIAIEGGPVPLRSEEFPLGLPNLSQINETRVQQANRVYDAIFVLIHDLNSVGSLVSVENPERSLFWWMPKAEALLKPPYSFADSILQHCKYTMNRAMRPKWVRMRASFEAMAAISGECSLKHVHLAWGRRASGDFVTAGESEYPPELASNIAQLFLTEIRLKGYDVRDPAAAPIPPLSKRLRAATSKQPRGKALPQLVPEFCDVIYCKRSEALERGLKILRNTVPTSLILERGQQVEAVGKIQSTDNPENLDGESPEDEIAAGVFHTPEQYIEKALKLEHPSDTFLRSLLPKELVNSIAQTFNNAPAVTAQKLVDKIKYLVKFIQDHAAEDDKAYQNLNSHVKVVLTGKKLVSFSKLLEMHKYPDTTIVKDLADGFELFGMQPFSKAFQHCIKLPTTTAEEVRAKAELNNKLNLIRTKSSGDTELDSSFYQQAHEEMLKGWLIGPYRSVAEYQKAHGHVPNLSRRFPLQQSDKIRSIDDMLESGSNLAYGCQDKLVLHDADFLAAVLRTIESVFAGSRSVTDSEGNEHQIQVSKAIDLDTFGWKGKTIDLSEAYKQCATSPDSMWLSAVAVYEPKEGAPHIFAQRTLPFGASGSVVAFNRVSRALWFLGAVFLEIIWGNFFDDYPTLAPTVLSSSVSTAAILMFKLLGFRVSDKPGKDKPWSELFVALGVQFDIARLPKSQSLVLNKPERVAAVSQALEDCERSKYATLKVCDSLKGKLNYMEAQIFGRAGRGKLVVFSRCASTGKSFSDDEVSVLKWIVEWLKTSPPRPITLQFNAPPLLLFTDGACEPLSEDEKLGGKLVTCAAVLLDRRDSKALFFGCRVDNVLITEWKANNMKEQMVTEAELLPQLIARRLWPDRLYKAKLIAFTDSEPAKFAMVRGSSEVLSCRNIVSATALADSKLLLMTWYTRVPSSSNVADKPSRLDFDFKVQGFELVKCEAIQPKSLSGGTWRAD